MGVFIALIAMTLILLVFCFKYLETYWKRRGIPHDKPHFLYGNLKGWKKTSQFGFLLQKVYNKHKGSGIFAGFYFLLRPVILATDLDFIKQILITDFNKFDERGTSYNEKDDPLSGNLFNLNGEKWRPLRQKLTPTFTSGKMKLMFPTLLKVANRLTDVFAENIAELDNPILEITDFMARFTADVIGSCAFGLECNSLSDPQSEFVVIGKRAFNKTFHNPFIDNFLEAFPYLARMFRMKQIDPACHDFYMRITKETVDFREKNNVECFDFMNMLIELKNKSKLTFNELAAQCFIFFIAGFDTSSQTMGYALYELAKHEEVQNKLRKEINELMEKNQNHLTYECLQNMHYLEQVIYETLRKFPILPHLIRLAKERYETSDPKYYIEKGTTVIIPIFAIHHDPDLHANPEQFDPDRFSEPEIKKRRSCSWIPFGIGPRQCVGMRFGQMQAAIGLAVLIRNFKFQLCEESPKEIKFKPESLLLTPMDGIRLKVEKV